MKLWKIVDEKDSWRRIISFFHSLSFVKTVQIFVIGTQTIQGFKAKQTISTQWANRKSNCKQFNNNNSSNSNKEPSQNPYWCLLSFCSSLLTTAIFLRSMWFGNICCRFSIVIRIVASIWIIYFLEIGCECCTSLILPEQSAIQHDTIIIYIFLFEVYFLLLWKYDKRKHFGPSVQNHAQLRTNHLLNLPNSVCWLHGDSHYPILYILFGMRS